MTATAPYDDLPTVQITNGQVRINRINEDGDRYMATALDYREALAAGDQIAAARETILAAIDRDEFLGAYRAIVNLYALRGDLPLPVNITSDSYADRHEGRRAVFVTLGTLSELEMVAASEQVQGEVVSGPRPYHEGQDQHVVVWGRVIFQTFTASAPVPSGSVFYMPGEDILTGAPPSANGTADTAVLPPVAGEASAL